MIPLIHHPAAPLPDWTHYGSYDTAKECEDAQLNLIERSKRPDFKAPPGHNYSLKDVRVALISSECIETDDPRLTK
jgi:hypothetical protein